MANSRDPTVAPPPTWSQRSIGAFGFGFRSEASVPCSRATAVRCSRARSVSSTVGSAPFPTVWQPCGVACHLRHSRCGQDRHTVFNVVVTRFLDRGRGAFAPASPNTQVHMCAVVAQLLPLPTCSSGRWPTCRISLEPVATISDLRSIALILCAISGCGGTSS